MHRIRLRKPWQSWFDGARLVFHRCFGRPTGLSPHQNVWIEIDNHSGACEVYLNHQLLGTASAESRTSWEVSRLLLPRNELELVWHTRQPAEEKPAAEPPSAVVILIEEC